ncbi:MAG: RsmB/NOP family class I SAM-dependent RNA methyltransferase [Spirochaetaceae bacterium]
MKGQEAFHSYYHELFGNRWPALVEAMQGDPSYLSLSAGLLQPYYIDVASVVAASLLPLPSGGAVLDMCAAPGGKTLVLARRLALTGSGAALTANERSSARRARLHRVLDDHLPPPAREKVRITGHDATKWGLYEREAYEAILCDVPCSSERHLVQAPEHLGRWSPNRIRSLSSQAVAFLAAAADAIKPGGYVLYSTCALTKQENDAVVARVLRRRSAMSSVPPAEIPTPEIPELSPAATHPDSSEDTPETGPRAQLPVGTATTYGRHILPDTDAGAGPLYYALLRKGLHS